MPTSQVAPGTIFVFRLENGRYGACRVVRGPNEAEAEGFAGHHLVCPTQFVGDAAAAFKHADTKRVLKHPQPGFFWVRGAPPAGFKNVGVLPPNKKEPARESRQGAPWAMFPNVVRQAWREREQRAAVAADREQAKDDDARALHEAAADLAKRERFDLSKVVPLAKPKQEREPREVVTAFIAAMHQWENESARIDKKAIGGAAHGMEREELGVVFDEFCTRKERKYERISSYATPPEYDQENESIVALRFVGPRRAEVETRRASGLTQGTRIYILLKTNGAWLIAFSIAATVLGDAGLPSGFFDSNAYPSFRSSTTILSRFLRALHRPAHRLDVGVRELRRRGWLLAAHSGDEGVPRGRVRKSLAPLPGD
jgi:hypothetical protein